MISEDLKEKREAIKKMARKERNRQYYEKVKQNKKRCEICWVDVLPYYWDAHIKTARHNNWSSLVKVTEPTEETKEPSIEDEPKSKKKNEKRNE